MDATISKAALLRRFPFLEQHLTNNRSRYIDNPALITDATLEPITHRLKIECVRWERGHDTAGDPYSTKKIILLDANGESVGIVGERPMIILAKRFLWWKWPERTEQERFDETLLEALGRSPGPVHSILIFDFLRRCMTLFLPPDGYTVDTYLPIKIIEDQRVYQRQRGEESRQETERLQQERLQEDEAVSARLQELNRL